MKPQETKAWIFLSLAMASPDGPVDFAGISQAAAGINQSIPSQHQLQNNIRELISAGLVDKKGNAYSLSTEGRKLYALTDPIMNIYDRLRFLQTRFAPAAASGFQARPPANPSFPWMVWGSTLLGAPILFILWNYRTNSQANFGAFATLYFYFIIFGLLFSLPAYFIYQLVIRVMLSKNLSDLSIRIYSALVVSLCLFVTLLLVNGGNISSFVEDGGEGLLFPYLIPVLLFSFVYRPRKRTN